MVDDHAGARGRLRPYRSAGSRVVTDRKLIVELTARYRLPAVYGLSAMTGVGGLVSYGVDLPELFRQRR